jgi:hypothetical protein
MTGNIHAMFCGISVCLALCTVTVLYRQDGVQLQMSVSVTAHRPTATALQKECSDAETPHTHLSVFYLTIVDDDFPPLVCAKLNTMNEPRGSSN